MNKKEKSAPLIIGTILILSIFFFQSNNLIYAQERDDKPVNLKVLPAASTGRDIDKIMDTYTRALGVHCDYCHSDPNDKTVKRNDFAADWNPNKLVARTMISMVNTINSNLLKDSRNLKSSINEVSCITCHHGSSNIDLLENLLFETYQKKGIDASFKEYDDLKKQYYGSFTYDFGNRTLLNYASLVSAKGSVDDAISIAKKNSELFPDAVISYLYLGNALSRKGNKEEAVKYFEKALQIDPNNRNASQQLKRLKG